MTRSRTSAKQAGARAEKDVAAFMAAYTGDNRIERRARNGANDRGDITGVRTINGGRVVIEVKDCAKLDLAGWVNEAETERGNDDASIGVVWHKKRGKADPADWYVTMTGATFAKLLEGAC